MNRHGPLATLLCLLYLFGFVLTGDSLPQQKTGKQTDKTLPVPEANDSLEGWYACSGSQHKKDYHGMVCIRKSGSTYIVMWLMEGGAHTLGIGIRRDNYLSVGWNAPGGSGRGTTLYTIHPGGQLKGNWALLPTDGKQGTETLTFIRKLATPPEAPEEP